MKWWGLGRLTCQARSRDSSPSGKAERVIGSDFFARLPRRSFPLRQLTNFPLKSQQESAENPGHIASTSYMKAAIWFVIAVTLSPVEVSAQAINYPLRVQRQRWLSQIATNPYPVAYRFGAQVLGAGLATGEVRSSVTTNQLMLTTVYSVTALTYGTNFPAWTEALTNMNGGLADFNRSYPTGAYSMYYKGTLGVPFTRTVNLAISKDFPAVDPVFTNLTPLVALRTNMTFGWPVFSSTSSDFVRFTLLEGKIGSNYSNLLQTIIANGIEPATNGLKLLAWERKLSPSQNQVTVSNINPQLDHMTLLEFASFSANGNDTLYDVSSISANATFFFSLRVLSDPVDQVVEPGDVALFNVLAVGAQPLNYQWCHAGTNLPGATNLFHLIPDARSIHAGQYIVTVSNLTGAVTSAPAMLILTNYGPVRIVLDEYQLNGEGHVQFRVSGDAPSFVIEACPDLAALQWTKVATLAATNGVTYYKDTNAPILPKRFYRARSP